jgi:AraC-like DNA-binding protein
MIHHILLLLLGVIATVATSVGVIKHNRSQKKSAEDTYNPAESIPAPRESAPVDQFLYDRCCRFMTERRPFLVENFSLQDLANAVYTNKVYLSKTINRFSGKNFRQYVNYYRVMYAMELYRGNMGLRITELTQLSGFRSTTVFLRSFKCVMGEQPSHWCSRVRNKYGRKR